MKPKNQEVLHCSFCDKHDFEQMFSLSKFVVRTKEKTIEKGILSLLKELNRYCLDKSLHLSASEIILLRPDILLEFLKIHYNSEILSYQFQDYKICNNCFKNYKKLVPER